MEETQDTVEEVAATTPEPGSVVLPDAAVEETAPAEETPAETEPVEEPAAPVEEPVAPVEEPVEEPTPPSEAVDVPVRTSVTFPEHGSEWPGEHGIEVIIHDLDEIGNAIGWHKVLKEQING